MLGMGLRADYPGFRRGSTPMAAVVMGWMWPVSQGSMCWRFGPQCGDVGGGGHLRGGT
jgi:hypothetical protein